MTHLGLSPLSLFNRRYYFRVCVRQTLSGTDHVMESFWISWNYSCHVCWRKRPLRSKDVTWMALSHKSWSTRIQWCLVGGFNRDWKQFFQNHVTKIRRLVPVHYWRHCPGKENPADVQSIGILPHELKYNSLWWNGPQWSTKLKEESQDIDETTIPGECLSKMKKPQECLNLLVTER